MVRTTVASQLAKIRKEREALEKREKALMSKVNDKVLARIVQLAKDAGLTAADITKALGEGKPVKAKKTTRTLKKVLGAPSKVAPKYRNPSNAEQTWTGRGKAPLWAKAMKDAGKLDESLIAS